MANTPHCSPHLGLESMKLQCCIIDDDPLAIEVLQSYLSEVSKIRICDTFLDPLQALQHIDFESIDGLFIDIDMPHMNGLEFIRHIPTEMPVILTTAHTEYAVESYELQVLDYLVKPYSFERFLKATERLKEIYTKKTNVNHIFIKHNKKNIKIYLNEILYIQSLKDYICVVTASDSYIIYNTLTGFTNTLPDDLFIRVHKSYTVAIQKIKAFGSSALEIHNTKIPVGRVYINKLKTLLNL